MAHARMVLSVAAVAALGPASAALAHHGWSTYTVDNFEISGTVTELRLGNPHDRMSVEDEEGQVWDVWLGPPLRNQQNGFGREQIAVGDTVTAFGQRNPDRYEVKTEKLTVNGEVYELYPERLRAAGL